MAIDRNAPEAVSGMTNAEVAAKVASAKTEGHAAGVAEGKSQAETAAAAATEAAVVAAKGEAVKGERERIKSITSLTEAKGREGAALALALTTDMNADQAKATLATLPQTGAEGTRSQNSPIGLALGSPGNDKPDATAVLSPDEVAAAVNKTFGARK